VSTEISHHDVVIVGGRCAGAATARLLAARGHDVVILERSDLRGDPLSTHGLIRGGVVELSRWGLLDDVLASGAPAVREVTLGALGVEDTRPVKDRAGVDLLVAPRRTHLDSILARAAVDAGAELRTRTTVRRVVHDPDGRVTGVVARTPDGREVTFLGRYVVGADGLRSTMAGDFGARVQQSFAADVTTFYTYVDRVPWRGYELHVGERSYAGAFPTHEGQAAVWLCRPTALSEDVRRAGSRRSEALVDAIALTAPALGRRLREGRVVSATRGIVAPPNYVREAYGNGWALVGDAGYHRDPMTGHGITDAFRDAELLADALHDALLDPAPGRHALAPYEARRDEALAEVFTLTRELSRFPEPTRFVELQIELGAALEREALMLASLPAPAGPAVLTA
jgi:flavin-dependent dehydrogenase